MAAVTRLDLPLLSQTKIEAGTSRRVVAHLPQCMPPRKEGLWYQPGPFNSKLRQSMWHNKNEGIQELGWISDRTVC